MTPVFMTLIGVQAVRSPATPTIFYNFIFFIFLHMIFSDILIFSLTHARMYYLCGRLYKYVLLYSIFDIHIILSHSRLVYKQI